MSFHNTDLWAAILYQSIKLFHTRVITRAWWDDHHYGNKWKDHLVMGRGHGSYPKPPFKWFRGDMYKYSPITAGHVHFKLFNEKGHNGCQRCGYTYGNDTIMPLDYFAFYPTGEVFTWVDPVFLAGMLHVDPRLHDQPEDSPLTIKWLCKPCWTKLRVIARQRAADNELRWAAYAQYMGQGEDYPQWVVNQNRWDVMSQSAFRRVFMDRRAVNSPFTVHKGVTDRRVEHRRSSDKAKLVRAA